MAHLSLYRSISYLPQQGLRSLTKRCNNTTFNYKYTQNQSQGQLFRDIKAMSGTAASVPKYYVLTYNYVADVLEKRGPYRDAHIGAIKQMENEGKVILGGAFGSPPKGATIVFKDCQKQDVAQFVANDPYYKNELITSYTIEPLAVVVGG